MSILSKEELSKEATELLQAIDNYEQASTKTDYEFTDKEDYRIAVAMDILRNHIKILRDYELKKHLERNK